MRYQNEFKYGDNVLDVVDKYKYLGTILNGHRNFTVTANILTCAGGRVLNSLLLKLSKFSNIGNTTFTKRFETSVWKVLEYGYEIWGM